MVIHKLKTQMEFKERKRNECNFYLCMENFVKQIKMQQRLWLSCLEITWSEQYFPTFR